MNLIEIDVLLIDLIERTPLNDCIVVMDRKYLAITAPEGRDERPPSAFHSTRPELCNSWIACWHQSAKKKCTTNLIIRK